MNCMVPYLAAEAIDRNATALLLDYMKTRDVTLQPPIPVEDIIEKHLKLRIEFDDMHARHNIPRPRTGETEILGAIYRDRSIFIDESLDPEEWSTAEGRYRFTLAHELGHFRLHKDCLHSSKNRGLHADRPRVEYRANYFAAALLMPVAMVFDLWGSQFGSLRPWIFRWRYGDPRQQPRKYWQHSLGELSASDADELNRNFDRLSFPLSRQFEVSVEAARIRLENLDASGNWQFCSTYDSLNA